MISHLKSGWPDVIIRMKLILCWGNWKICLFLIIVWVECRSTCQKFQNFSFKFDSISLFLTVAKKFSWLCLGFLMAINTLGFCKAVAHQLTLLSGLRSLAERHYGHLKCDYSGSFQQTIWGFLHRKQWCGWVAWKNTFNIKHYSSVFLPSLFPQASSKVFEGDWPGRARAIWRSHYLLQWHCWLHHTLQIQHPYGGGRYAEWYLQELWPHSWPSRCLQGD